MSNMHRLIWFDKEIRAMQYPNRITLAEKFEISIRQAQRDIDYLRDTLGASIMYDGKRRGYFYKDENYILPNIYVNDVQKKMLKFLAYRYENYSKTPKVVQMSELFNKLTNEEEVDDEIPIFDLDKPSVQNYNAIYKAIQTKNKLEIEYKEAYKGIINMKIDPYKLFYKYRTDYLIACINSDNNIVILRLDRIVKLSTLKERFEMKNSFSMDNRKDFTEKEPFVTRILLDGNIEFKEEKAIHVRRVEEKFYELEFYDVDELINILLCTGYWDRVISPKWLKNKLVNRCQTIIEKLKG